MNLASILEKSFHTGDLTKDEIVYLLSLNDKEEIKALLNTADMVRYENMGDGVFIRGLIEFSNFCARQCSYCGLRAENPNINRYRMPIEEIIHVAVKIVNKGIKTIVLQSGEDPWFTAERMAEIISGIKAKVDCAITLSIGERTREEYKIMKDAGADRYLLRHETANPDLYRRLHPDMEFADRVRCLRDLRELGYQVGAGCMVGLPGQTIDDMADDVLFVRSLNADMVGVGPFIPHPDTPLGETPGGTLDMTLKMVALMRIVTRDAHLPATTAVGSIDPIGREKALQAGANIVMPNYTPLKYRVNYEIYPNKRCIAEDPEHCHGCMQTRIESIGRNIVDGQGHSLKMKRHHPTHTNTSNVIDDLDPPKTK
ncbi:MAG: [FeFe] hydrogenase H-cluster radical SAM maturase HydE [Armatimonadota bacterium]